MHVSDDWFELEKNAPKRPRGWKSHLWWWGTSILGDNKINELINSPSYTFLLINRYSLPPDTQYLIRAYHYDTTQSSIVDLGASLYFITKNAPKHNMDPTARRIRVSTAPGQIINSESTCDNSIPWLPSNFITTCHVMPGFQENLVGMCTMWDAVYTVTLTKNEVTIYSPTGTPIITGCREYIVPCLWRMSLLPIQEDLPQLSLPSNVQKLPVGF